MKFIGGEASAKRAFVDDTMATIRAELTGNEAVRERMDSDTLEFLMGVTENYYVPDKHGLFIEPTRDQLDSGGIPVVALDIDEEYSFSTDFAFLDDESRLRAEQYLESIGTVGPIQASIESAERFMKWQINNGHYVASLANEDAWAIVERPGSILGHVSAPGADNLQLRGRMVIVLQYSSEDKGCVTDSSVAHELRHVEQGVTPAAPLNNGKFAGKHYSLGVEADAYPIGNTYLYGKMIAGYEPKEADIETLATGYAINQMDRTEIDLDSDPWELVQSVVTEIAPEIRAAENQREFWLAREEQVLGGEPVVEY